VSQIEATKQIEYTIDGNVVLICASRSQNPLYVVRGKGFFSFLQHLEHQLPCLGRLVSPIPQDSNRIWDHGDILPGRKPKCNNIAISL
jgi:hypothetical protein